jgi:hypothetical protein
MEIARLEQLSENSGSPHLAGLSRSGGISSSNSFLVSFLDFADCHSLAGRDPRVDTLRGMLRAISSCQLLVNTPNALTGL